jgi:DNA-directed RNA polymerase subunit alpha
MGRINLFIESVMSTNFIEKPNFFISCKESKIENPRSFYGCFYLGPFNNGQSLTVANTLRRILLSELSGIAITSVEIEGASHEYHTLPGVQDSILDIVLNLKEILLKTRFPLREPIFAYLEAMGPGIVRAADFKLPFFVQTVDPNQYIATLSENGLLKMKFTIQEGKNYQIYNYKKRVEPLENPFQLNRPILLDAVFMPVLKVNYTIENIDRTVEGQSNQVVILEIWTNGSITPRQALYQSLNQSTLLFSQLQKLKILNTLSMKSLIHPQ